MISVIQDIYTKLMGNKGYISKKSLTELFNQNIILMTKIQNNKT